MLKDTSLVLVKGSVTVGALATREGAWCCCAGVYSQAQHAAVREMPPCVGAKGGGAARRGAHTFPRANLLWLVTAPTATNETSIYLRCGVLIACCWLALGQTGT